MGRRGHLGLTHRRRRATTVLGKMVGFRPRRQLMGTSYEPPLPWETEGVPPEEPRSAKNDGTPSTNPKSTIKEGSKGTSGYTVSQSGTKSAPSKGGVVEGAGGVGRASFINRASASLRSTSSNSSIVSTLREIARAIFLNYIRFYLYRRLTFAIVAASSALVSSI